MLHSSGFIRMSTAADRISLNKGYTKYGFADKVYHIHLRFFGDNDELYFRDYLNAFPKIAKEKHGRNTKTGTSPLSLLVPE